MTAEAHNDVVRREFTQQAESYAANPSIADPERAERIVRAVDPLPEARVLDVAAGPAYVAMAFAARCREVVALDLTEAPLALARQAGDQRGLANLRLVVGDAAHLPFADGSFDVVVCCLALHHMEDPGRVVREMARVCRAGGRVAIEDMLASEHADRAAYQNRVETLRDPSHVRALPLSDLLRLLAAAGVEVESVFTDARTQDVDRWLANARTPDEPAAEVRRLLESDALHDLSGLYPSRRDGQLTFTHRMALVVGRKPAEASSPLGEALVWTPARPPERAMLSGATVRLEPVDPDRHAAALFAAGHDERDPHLWDYMSVGPFADEDAFTAWLRTAAASSDPLFFTVVDQQTDRPLGMVSYLRITPTHGVIEIGFIWFGPALQRTRQATETIYLLARHVFEDLGYRRLEWKCDALNARSRRAAARFGFSYEGLFRQHMIVKGRNRDTAWFAMLDRDWPAIGAAFAAWLAPANFDAAGQQRHSLAAFRDAASLGHS